MDFLSTPDTEGHSADAKYARHYLQHNPGMASLSSKVHSRTALPPDESLSTAHAGCAADKAKQQEKLFTTLDIFTDTIDSAHVSSATRTETSTTGTSHHQNAFETFMSARNDADHASHTVVLEAAAFLLRRGALNVNKQPLDQRQTGTRSPTLGLVDPTNKS